MGLHTNTQEEPGIFDASFANGKTIIKNMSDTLSLTLSDTYGRFFDISPSLLTVQYSIATDDLFAVRIEGSFAMYVDDNPIPMLIENPLPVNSFDFVIASFTEVRLLDSPDMQIEPLLFESFRAYSDDSTRYIRYIVFEGDSTRYLRSGSIYAVKYNYPLRGSVNINNSNIGINFSGHINRNSQYLGAPIFVSPGRWIINNLIEILSATLTLSLSVIAAANHLMSRKSDTVSPRKYKLQAKADAKAESQPLKNKPTIILPESHKSQPKPQSTTASSATQTKRWWWQN